MESGLVVLDTNTLLDLYRYHETTRSNFLRLYSSLGDRLWVPHHVMFEFHERRVEVLDERVGYPDSTISDLRGLLLKYNERLTTWINRVSLGAGDKSEIIALVDKASGEVEEKIRELSHDETLEDADDTSKDPIIIALEPILHGHIGKPLSTDELREARTEARKRIEDGRPPGFMDAGKKGGNADGDYLIWSEIMSEAARRHVDVLYVTRDQKKDWWRIEKGQAKGPRWELAAELESHAGVRLYMLRPASLAEHAPEIVSEESVRDAKRVSNKAYIGWRPRPKWGTVRDYIEVSGDSGGTDIACRFIFDDGSGSEPIVWHNANHIPELAEYARGIFSDGELSIKVGAEDMVSAERVFNRINAMEAGERALMFIDSSDLHENCGWAWTSDYKLVKAASGLTS